MKEAIKERVYTFSKDDWQNFVSLLELIKNDCTDVQIVDNVISQRDDLGISTYFVDKVFVNNGYDVSFVLNNIKSTLPVLKIFDSEIGVRLVVNPISRLNIFSDEYTEVHLRYTISLNNDSVKKEQIENTKEIVKVSLPTKILRRAHEIAQNFQSDVFSLQSAGDAMAMFIDSRSKSRSSKIYMFKGVLWNDVVKSLDLPIDEKQIQFSVLPLSVLYKLVSKTKITPEGVTEETVVDEVKFSLGKDESNIVLIFETQSVYNQYLKIISKRRVMSLFEM